MNVQDIPSNVGIQILNFFNRVKVVSDITDTLIQDDPSDGPGRTIGTTLAARILRTRSEQEFNQFMNLEQLDAISGFGKGTWKDLVYTFGRKAAEAFRDNLYVNNVISKENWPVWIFEFPFEDKESFQEVVDDEANYRAFISQKLGEITRKEEVIDSLAEKAINGVKEAYIERFEDPTLSAHSFTIWFYRLDPANWFSFDRMNEQTSAYFDYYVPKFSFQRMRFDTLIEFVAFKGVPGTIIKPAGSAAPDLLTTINYPEKSVTIWMSTLYD
ncbi:MAG: hypothetical protein AAFO07_08415 [Bacteroidota bacterium]